MSNFENEYKNYAKESMPDLWDRIEAGIDALEESSEKQTDKIVPINKERTVSEKKPAGKFFKKYSGLIVAAAAVIIVAPAIVYMSNGGMKSSEATSNTMQAFADAAPVEEACATEELMYEESAAEADVTEETAIEEEPVFETEIADEASACEEAACEEAVESEEAYEETDNQEKTAIVAENLRNSSDTEYPVSVEWVDADTKSFDCPVIVVDENSEGSWIRLKFEDSVANFEIMKIEIRDATDDGDIIYDGVTVYEQEFVEKGDEMVLQLNFPGDTPNHAIKFTDRSGEIVELAIMMSGYDGSVVFSNIS